MKILNYRTNKWLHVAAQEIARRLEEQSFNDSDPDWQILMRTCLRSKNATPGDCVSYVDSGVLA